MVLQSRDESSWYQQGTGRIICDLVLDNGTKISDAADIELNIWSIKGMETVLLYMYCNRLGDNTTYAARARMFGDNRYGYNFCSDSQYVTELLPRQFGATSTYDGYTYVVNEDTCTVYKSSDLATPVMKVEITTDGITCTGTVDDSSGTGETPTLSEKFIRTLLSGIVICLIHYIHNGKTACPYVKDLWRPREQQWIDAIVYYYPDEQLTKDPLFQKILNALKYVQIESSIRSCNIDIGGQLLPMIRNGLTPYTTEEVFMKQNYEQNVQDIAHIICFGDTPGQIDDDTDDYGVRAWTECFVHKRSEHSRDWKQYKALYFQRDLMRCFSNFFERDFVFHGITFHSGEAAFQACKLIDGEDFTRFNEQAPYIASLTPRDAKRYGRSVELCSDWEKVKEKCMYEVVKAKFEQNEDLKEALLNTGTRYIIEDTRWHDNVWGMCTCERCATKLTRNLLGKCLMKVRADLGNKPCFVTYSIRNDAGQLVFGAFNPLMPVEIARVVKKHDVGLMSDFIRRLE